MERDSSKTSAATDKIIISSTDGSWMKFSPLTRDTDLQLGRNHQIVTMYTTGSLRRALKFSLNTSANSLFMLKTQPWMTSRAKVHKNVAVEWPNFWFLRNG